MKIVKGLATLVSLLTSEALKLLSYFLLRHQKLRRSPRKAKAVTEKRANLELLHDENEAGSATPKTLLLSSVRYYFSWFCVLISD